MSTAPDESGPGGKARAAKFSLASFTAGLLANTVGLATGIMLPITTEPGMLVTESGYEWSQRVWTHVTRVTMWTGLTIMFALVAVAVLLGLYARFLYHNLALGQVMDADPKSLMLIPSRDLGIVVALVAPVSAFLAEMISMALVQALG